MTWNSMHKWYNTKCKYKIVQSSEASTPLSLTRLGSLIEVVNAITPFQGYCTPLRERQNGKHGRVGEWFLPFLHGWRRPPEPDWAKWQKKPKPIARIAVGSLVLWPNAWLLLGHSKPHH